MQLLEARLCLAGPVEQAGLVQRNPYHVGLLGDGLENRLADPPHGIGDELEAAGLVKLLRCLDEADVALVDQVRQTQALVLVLLGYRHNKAQVGIDKLVKGLLVTLVDALGKLHLLID